MDIYRLFYRPIIWVRVLHSYLCTFSGVKSNIYNAEETVAEILKGKSLIRFGDGEFGIYRGVDIHYQPWSDKLQKEFEAIKGSYESNPKVCNFLLAVPKKYMQCSGAELGRKRVLVSSWAESRLFFKQHFNRSLHYGDAFLFEKSNRNIYGKIWEQPGDERLIIFVHNNPAYAQDFAKTYNREVEYVACPSHDSFKVVDKLLENILAVINGRGLSYGDVQIVLSAGPAGKVIASHLSEAGYQCIDAGHCWDAPLES